MVKFLLKKKIYLKKVWKSQILNKQNEILFNLRKIKYKYIKESFSFYFLFLFFYVDRFIHKYIVF
jgi:hypothetical protein